MKGVNQGDGSSPYDIALLQGQVCSFLYLLHLGISRCREVSFVAFNFSKTTCNLSFLFFACWCLILDSEVSPRSQRFKFIKANYHIEWQL